MFAEGCETDALRMFSQLRHTKLCEANTILLSLLNVLVATLTFHWQAFPPVGFHLSCSLYPEHFPPLPMASSPSSSRSQLKCDFPQVYLPV